MIIQKGKAVGACHVFFLSDQEKQLLVKTPFRNYNKATEILNSHENKEYHKLCLQKANVARSQMKNLMDRVDISIDDGATENVQENEQILLFIVDAAILCTKQQLTVRGHRDDEIDISQNPVQNEGNFIAVIRLLAEKNEHLLRHLIEGSKNEHLFRHLIEGPKNEYLLRHLIEGPKNEHLLRHLIEGPKNEHLFRHLIEGPKNDKYTSKTIQNEIVSDLAADLYRNYIRECLNKCPYFSIIADETTSQGGLVLSICIRLLDFHGDPSNPCKREFFLDM